jgi:hypothetical protein
MRLTATICLLSSLFLVGCDHSSPLAGIRPPDTISIGSQTVVSNKEDIDRFVSVFTAPEHKWRPYRDTFPAPDLAAVAVLRSGGAYLASVYIYSHSDWVIVSAGSAPLTYSTTLTSEEHKSLFRLLKLEMPNQSPEPTAVSACRSAVAVHVASRRWLSFLR